MADKLISPEKGKSILKQYIDSLNEYKTGDQNSLSKLLANSRIVSAILSGDSHKLDIKGNGGPLKDAIKTFLGNLAGEKVPNKKLLLFFENNFKQIAKELDETPNSLRGADTWNHLIYRYFVTSPGLIKNNAQTIFDNLEAARPKA